MNGVANITDKILAEAKAYESEQLALAKSEADAISGEYAAQASEVVKEIKADCEAKVKLTAERAQSRGEMDTRKAVLAAKQEAISAAFDEALAQMVKMPDEDKILMMVRLGIKYQTGDAEYIFSKAERDTIGAVVVETINALYAKQQLKETFSGTLVEKIKKLVVNQPEKLTAKLSDKTGDFSGGFILKQGDIENNCTFEILVGGVREELESEVSSILFS